MAYYHSPNRFVPNELYRLRDKCDMLESFLVKICTEMEESRSIHRLPLKVVRWWENFKENEER